MANLVRLTSTKVTRLTNVGSYSFNTLKIKKVSPLGTGSLLYYHDGTPGVAGIVKIEVAEAPAVIKSALVGPLDMQIELNVVSINGKDHVLTENIKTSDIILGIIDNSDNTYSVLIIGDNLIKYRVHNTLSNIETAANNYAIGGGVITSQYAMFTDPVSGLRVRFGARNSGIFFDRELTSTGFAGTEGVDWENIGAAQ